MQALSQLSYTPEEPASICHGDASAQVAVTRVLDSIGPRMHPATHG